ncbi:hypothetical protein [Anaerovibrio sp. RM50]|uniref:hypothetical protein n=1 Tax=Anaerovibrio sp. RM50 TaxID=1200557 RepID=UPI0012EB879E|nr:hypothetical protein [Anaerovibrio sp. RM50]
MAEELSFTEKQKELFGKITVVFDLKAAKLENTKQADDSEKGKPENHAKASDD